MAREPGLASSEALQTWDEMKAYVGFSPADHERLRAFAPIVEPELPRIVAEFYSTIERYPRASSVLKGPAQVERLKNSLQHFILSLLNGPWENGCYERLQRIGHVHVRVQLPERYVFTAMSLIRQDMCGVAMRTLGPERQLETCHAIMRVMDLALAVMSSTYLVAHEERRLRGLQDLIIENMPVTVLCLDRDGRVTSATRPSTRLFGSEIDRGRHFEAFLPAALVEAGDLHSHVGRALATGHEITVPRVVVDDKGTPRHFRFTLVPLEHELARLLLHVEELTDVVVAEQRLNETEALARIGSLAAHLAHEIRNPLAAISATLQVIVGSLPADDRRKRVLSKVQLQVHRLDRLVTDLLGYARPARVQLAAVSLVEVAQEALRQSGVPAILQDLGGEPAMADSQYLVQAVTNLLQNARDALAEAELPVEGQVFLRVGPGARLEVADTGPGIAEEVASRLFEPFVTSKTKGTGLGLAISRKMVRAMGGDLVLLDGGDGGARFQVTLAEATG